MSRAVGERQRERRLSRTEKRRLALLGLPTFGLALSITIVSTYLPTVAKQFTSSTTAIGAVVGGRRGAVMALAYALLIPLMREDERGVLTGLYSVSRGIGITVGPVVTGALISLTATGPFADTNGFQATWLVPAVAVLASLALLPRLELAG